MMTNSTRCEWDVLIVDGTEGPTGESARLRNELAGHGLRVKLDAAGPPGSSGPSYSVVERSKRSAYCVVLLTITGDDGGKQTEFIAVPGPHFAGPNPVLATAEERVPPDSIEVGKLGDDVVGLAERIERRLRR